MSSLDAIASLDFVKKLQAHGGEVYLVGGNVRDYFLGYPHKDLDLIIRKLSYEQIVSILSKLGTVNKVGKFFGILKFRAKNNPDLEIDLSLPRVEKSTGTGHRDFDVDFDPNLPIEKDLERRDFTINAMAMDLTSNQLIDPFHGSKDLKNKLIRQVFSKAFEEDPLRMLRAVQFASRFNFEIEPHTLESMTKHAALIKTISKERIIEEIRKLFLAQKPSIGFHIMRKTRLLGEVFPFIEKMIGVLQPKKENEDVYDHTMKVLDASRVASEMNRPGDLDIMFAALLHDTGKPNTHRFDEKKQQISFYGHQIVSKKIARRWLNDYRATCVGVNTDRVLKLVEHHMFETKAYYSERAIRRFVNKIGKEDIFDLIDLRIADKKGGRYPDSMKGILNLRHRIQKEIDKKPPFGSKDLAINGHDLIALGFKPGPLLGQIQKFLVEQVLDNPELNLKETLENLVKEKFGSTS
ncbi:MAG: hypothetical protein A3G32_05120 [Deltaproteobacteria bacterium RIFCSPLOWO2_12_FULL_40_28]|nr:MAG: hypothetical protein A3C45_09230 [Deltaproteobacteria bacterium RIFCSPHIGHO2_02_FULL_40_28]OGQ19743.1 MAG: hypothetical protein A3E27_08425 [Deltaproteobacteria bacterium RIFCSPHIGHO2_12_FULL_40_32]OGQ41020.1 MAG: hypothetical protein A3I69_03840 [Deltaproteobacteria bacterium RIFCSPLOWO2_02_FULL_40_36]OGQ54136.1 MAG: hypothetical protein A3G32_05120 [Deltaproteobacteria bacterium RIFCSPLOWO2_12_FULL_40_28]